MGNIVNKYLRPRAHGFKPSLRKCLASVEVSSVEVCEGDRAVSCLGKGAMMKGSSHAFLLPPFDAQQPTLRVRFRRPTEPR